MPTARGKKPSKEAASSQSPLPSQVKAVNQPSSTTEQPVKFNPPYLRYKVPAENVKINADIAAVHKQAVKMFPRKVKKAVELSIKNLQGKGLLDGGGKGADQPVKLIKEEGRTVGSVVAKVSGTGTAVQLGESKTVTTQAGNNGKSAAAAVASGISLIPSGTVNIGFWCSIDIRAVTNVDATYYNWRLEIDGDQDYYIGTTWKPKMQFVLDGETYKLGAYYAKGSTTLKIRCTAVKLSFENDPVFYHPTSDQVVLQFSQSTPCLGLHSVSLSESSVKGGKNGKAPTLYVALNGPAPPGGQMVMLETNKPDKAWIMGSGYFHVPAGQTSEPLSWFLGTKNVIKDQDVRITARVNGTQGHADITIKK